VSLSEREQMKLVEAARVVLQHAYVPYSQFPVGAAVLATDGRVFVGTNVENASYGLTMCAERVALFSAISAGATALQAIAVTAEKKKPVSPCGACRQVMAELLSEGAEVFLDTGDRPLIVQMSDLLPGAFSGADLPTG
jgi:cytidine deaminase